MKNHPLVSVIIPTRNSEKTLKDCLVSIKNQSYSNTEIIVVDRDSSDKTKAIAKKFANKVLNWGPERCSQRNYGVKNSAGKFVFIIDSDMQLSKDVITDCVKLMNKRSTIVGIVIPEESFGEGFWAQCKKLERSFYNGVNWMEAARFFNKDSFNKVGGFDEKMVSGEDWDLSQRISKLGNIERISSFIHHNEGQINLFKTLKKKYYYSLKFIQYIKKKEHSSQVSNQTSIIKRYKLFLSNPKKLFKNPILGLGVLFMKTAEFAAGGVGIAMSKIGKK